ncbi:aldehyde ferredoxin oxidoreductase, partial [bacterium]|nr:aldehyde ferredoxin oxidoreductase [bacterium]
MDAFQKVLFVDTSNGFYKIKRYKVGDYFGPVDLGIHISDNHRSLNIGTGLFAGSIFPGSNRLIFTGHSPCWGGFFISSMGGAGLVFDNLGINMVSIVGKAQTPSILYLNRNHGEEIEVEIHPVDVSKVWNSGRKGVYSLFDHTLEKFGDRYELDPRILATGPSSVTTDFGGICSVPIVKKKLTFVDTWAGRGGFGSKMFQEHGIVAIIYGGTTVDEDFRDRNVADEWFEQKYKQKLIAKDFESTTKYRFDPKLGTGGTFGVNFATIKDRILAFNYKTIFDSDKSRLELTEKFITDHYLLQFNEETIEKKQQATCGEPCPAVCKKMNGEFKKDYEPYQTMGPLCGIFDQRAAEKLNHHCDAMGMDAISGG